MVMSPPAQKREPAPRNSTTREAASSAASAAAAASSPINSRLAALSTAGRFKTISRTASRRCTITLDIARLLPCSVLSSRRFRGDDIMAYTMLRGGRVLDIAAGTADPADILVED